MQPPPELAQEHVERAGVPGGLGCNALNDREQVLRPVAHFTQQRTQQPLAPAILGPVDDDGDEMQIVIGHLDHPAAEFEEGIVPASISSSARSPA